MEAHHLEVDTPAHSTDSATISTRSGHPPGTPKPPISPPRRRSSLAFSKVFTCSSPVKDDSDEPESPRKTEDLPQRPLSNVSRKRMPLGVQRKSVAPGHVAQMQQKLLQSAKAALKLDMAFAASPNGSIGSRLPPDQVAFSEPVNISSEQARGEDSAKGWRFSMAPQIVAGIDNDVREPVDEGSPALLDNMAFQANDEIATGSEPLSSGFTSPVADPYTNETEALDIQPGIQSSPPVNAPMIFDQALQQTGKLDASDLEGPMTDLKVTAMELSPESGSEESPTISHLKRISVEPDKAMDTDAFLSGGIILSEPARAAAESARAKRGLLRSLFPRKDHSKSTPPIESSQESSHSSASTGSPCPDPALHQLIELGKCPDPAVHLRNPSPMLMMPRVPVATENMMSMSGYSPMAINGGWYPRPPIIHRATATGSPMPFARMRSRPTPSGAEVPWIRDSYHYTGSEQRLPPAGHTRVRGDRPQQAGPDIAIEHFQPGWYYAQEPTRPSRKCNQLAYSFSTAAAKVGGQSLAADSRIRDSYKTDTLTPLARPPNRYRKTGISAVASNRGAHRVHGDHGHDHPLPSRKRPVTSRNRRMREEMQFRSSPPRSARPMQSHYKRPQPHEFEDENIIVDEDDRCRRPRLGKDESVMEIDDETRAAVRLSIFGTDMSDASQQDPPVLKGLSPNVTATRKGLKPRSKKKRRPSYWDGDLQEIRESPAGKHDHCGPGMKQEKALASPAKGMVQHGGPERRVCTSPAEVRAVDAQEHAGVIDIDEEDVEAGIRSGGDDTGSFITGVENVAETAEIMEMDE